MKFLFLSKSATSLSSAALKSLKIAPLLTPRSVKLCSESNDGPKNKTNTDFLVRCYEQIQVKEVFRRLRQRQTTNKSSDGQPIDRPKSDKADFDVCASRAGYAESGVKINCIRATPSLQDNNLSVAVDRIAQGAIDKLELRNRNKVRDYTKKQDPALLAECIPIYKE